MNSYQIGKYRAELFSKDLQEEKGISVYRISKSGDENIGAIRYTKSGNKLEILTVRKEYSLEEIEVLYNMGKVIANG